MAKDSKGHGSDSKGGADHLKKYIRAGYSEADAKDAHRRNTAFAETAANQKGAAKSPRSVKQMEFVPGSNNKEMRFKGVRSTTKNRKY